LISSYQRACLQANANALDKRIYHAATILSEVAGWKATYNRPNWLLDWQFIIDDARFKLRQLYPVSFGEN